MPRTMKKHIYTLSIATLALTILNGCKKDTITPAAPDPIDYTVPITYNFQNADFTSSTQQIDMLGELITYIRSTHTSTAAIQPTLSAQKLKDFYTNVNNVFSSGTLNTSGLQLFEKTNNKALFREAINANFEDAQIASVFASVNPTVSTAANGQSGKLISPARAVLVDAKGFEYKEFVEKGLMGAIFYSQACSLLSSIASFDNSQQVNGRTAQEKAWDEVFGYFGVPVAFPTNTVGLKYWGVYANSVNVAIECNATIMNAFLKGRAAISNKDESGRQAAALVVLNTWEKIAGAKCISYIKNAKNNLSDKATLHHNLSEAYGFITAFQYNSAKTISDADINILLNYFGNNLFNLNVANLDLAINKMATVFNINAALIP